MIKTILSTNHGDITLELDDVASPNTVANFVNYINKAHFDGLIFHRIIPNFMLQGGGFDSNLTQKKADAPIKIESKNGLRNVRGSIAMARTSDPHSATSQFFINVVNNHFLDYPGQDGHGYTVFGMVSEGLDICDKIAKVPTTRKNGMQDVPVEAVVINSIKLA
jgi:peptidyl-prolyl cis-trans isomerase A (cyclophilin A)/peptidyl-prolyl cis-trans isomerase B (cyclophilin B)